MKSYTKNKKLKKIFKFCKKVINIFFKLQCILISVQGVYVISNGDYSSISTGIYLISICSLLGISDNKKIEKYIINYFPIINNYLSRSVIIFFLSNISEINNNKFEYPDKFKFIKFSDYVEYFAIFISVSYILLFLFQKKIKKIKKNILVFIT